jgi:hypothetical protein
MKKIAARIIAFALPLILPLILPFAVLAQCGDGTASTGLCNPLRYTSLTDFLYRLLELVVQIGFPVIVLFIVFIGFKFVVAAASGKPEEISKVQSLFFWAIIGSIIVLGGKALSLAIKATVDQL